MNTKTITPNEDRRHQIKYFINKFEDTREAEWCINHRTNGQGQHCALGHVDLSGEVWEFAHLFSDDWWLGQHLIANINNGNNPRYQQPTPRQRILQALYDLLKT